MHLLFTVSDSCLLLVHGLLIAFSVRVAQQYGMVVIPQLYDV